MQILSEGLEIIARRGEELKDKIFNAPEVAALVRQATNNEHWGPAGTLMRQIADATEHFQDCQIVFSTLWERFTEKPTLGLGSNWRNIYKALLLLDYLIKNGSERAVNESRQNMMELRDLGRYHYIDTDGTDRGLSIRERAKQIADLLNDTKRLRTERKRSKASRGKFEQSIGSGGGGWDSRRRYDDFPSSRSSNNNSLGYADDSDPEDLSGEDFVVRKEEPKKKQNQQQSKGSTNGGSWDPFSGNTSGTSHDDDAWGDFETAPQNLSSAPVGHTVLSLGNPIGQPTGPFTNPVGNGGLGSLGVSFGNPVNPPNTNNLGQAINVPLISPVVQQQQTIPVVLSVGPSSLNSAPLGESKPDLRPNDPWAKSHLFDLSSISAPKPETSGTPAKPLGATIAYNRPLGTSPTVGQNTGINYNAGFGQNLSSPGNYGNTGPLMNSTPNYNVYANNPTYGASPNVTGWR